MFKWFKDRWNYLVGKSWEKQEGVVIETDLFCRTDFPETTATYERDLTDKESAVKYTEGFYQVDWEDLEDEETDPKPKKKSKKKKSKKSKKKGKKK